MNGFADRGLDEGAFGEKNSGFRQNIRTFDAFRKTSFLRSYLLQLHLVVPSPCYDNLLGSFKASFANDSLDLQPKPSLPIPVAPPQAATPPSS